MVVVDDGDVMTGEGVKASTIEGDAAKADSITTIENFMVEIMYLLHVCIEIGEKIGKGSI